MRAKRWLPWTIPLIKDEQGLTLAEIIVVLFVLSLALAFVLPNLTMQNQLPASVRHLIGMIRALSLASSTDRQMHRLHFDMEQGRYWATVMSQDHEEIPAINPSVSGSFHLPPPVLFRQISVLDGENRVPGRSFITFYPIGNADGALISLTEGTEQTILRLDPLSGDVRVIREGEPVPGVVSLPEHLQPLFVPRAAVRR
jgi:hypothetical protein